jgi:thiamine kinase-like enzyme
MSDHLSPDAVLSQIPGWEGASYTDMDQCVTNRLYLVEKDGHKAVLKIDAEVREAPLNNRREEARIQRAARGAGLAADVLYVTDTLLMTEYVEGVVWSLDCLEDDTNIEQLAIALRKLHSLSLTGRTFDVVGAARLYQKIIGGVDVEIVRQCVAKIEAAPRPNNLRCCHNDLVVANIINTPETKFLDWEYACDNDPFFDLATIAAHHKLTSQQCDTLLNAYFDGDGVRWREQLQRQAEVYEALLYLWTAAQPTGILPR